jgi:glycosyltransferase involved in cell wall biosynthesis
VIVPICTVNELRAHARRDVPTTVRSREACWPKDCFGELCFKCFDAAIAALHAARSRADARSSPMQALPNWIGSTEERPSRTNLHRAWHVGILNDYLRIPYANGSSFASQMLYREFLARGHDVTVVGPSDPDAHPDDLPRRRVCLAGLPLRNHPGLYLSVPTREALEQLENQRLDVVLGQTGSALMELGVWLRMKCGVPLVCVNTVHLPSVYNVLLPERIYRTSAVQRLFDEHAIPHLVQQSVDIYNLSDGLVVLAEGLKEYWRSRGVRVPIHVIPRSVEPRIFDNGSSIDPFPPALRPGARLLVVCRHTREKSVDRLLRIFAQLVSPAAPDATLTLIGDGPDHAALQKLARELGIAEKARFLGELPVTELPAYYRHADMFVYASLSETFGQVVGEAQWCGLATVAFADGMGISQQIEHGLTGLLVAPGPDEQLANWRFANSVLALLRNKSQRRALAERARRSAREERSPERGIARYYAAIHEARRHCRGQQPERRFGRADRVGVLARWTILHGLLALAGLLRRPAKLNLAGREQPNWDQGLNRIANDDAALPDSAADSAAE